MEGERNYIALQTKLRECREREIADAIAQERVGFSDSPAVATIFDIHKAIRSMLLCASGLSQAIDDAKHEYSRRVGREEDKAYKAARETSKSKARYSENRPGPAVIRNDELADYQSSDPMKEGTAVDIVMRMMIKGTFAKNELPCVGVSATPTSDGTAIVFNRSWLSNSDFPAMEIARGIADEVIAVACAIHNSLLAFKVLNSKHSYWDVFAATADAPRSIADFAPVNFLKSGAAPCLHKAWLNWLLDSWRFGLYEPFTEIAPSLSKVFSGADLLADDVVSSGAVAAELRSASIAEIELVERIYDSWDFGLRRYSDSASLGHAIESLEHEFLRAVRFQRDRDEFLRTQSQEQPATTSGGPALEGPIPPNRFAFGGVEVVLQPKDWEAVNALYQRDHRTMGVDDFALAVWGDEEMRKAQFDGIRRRVNNAFLGADIPFQLAKTGRQISLDKLK